MHGLPPTPGVPTPVLVYRDHLLRYSEVWVRSQGESLQAFRAHYAGSKRFADVALPEDRVFAVNSGSGRGRVAEGLFKVFGWAPALYAWAGALRPALVHAHYGIDGALVLPLAQRLGVPLVVTFHGYEVMMGDAYAARSFYLHRKYIRARRHLAENGTLFIAVSKYLRGLLLDQGFPPERTVAHYIGVDTGYFTPDPAVGRDPVVLFVGRLSPLKGCDLLIRAMAEVQRTCPDAELVVIGDGPEREALEALARSTLRRARFLGSQPQAQVREWLNRAKVFSVPSLTIETGECEAFGLVFAEAQAMGLPVVSFASGGIPEAVAHGKTGFLVPERDWRGLADGIGDLLEDDVLWTRFSRAARERAAASFDLTRQSRGLEDLYRMALREAGAQHKRHMPLGARRG